MVKLFEDFTGHSEEEEVKSEMALQQLGHIHEYSGAIKEMVENNARLPEWMRSKIAQAASDMSDIKHKMAHEQGLDHNFEDQL